MEWIDRIEFQLRGTPHTHSLFAIRKIPQFQSNRENIHSLEETAVQIVIDRFDKSVSGVLTPRHTEDVSGIPIADEDSVNTFLEREKEPDYLPCKDLQILIYPIQNM